MSLWDFQAAREGYVRANSVDDPNALTPAEFDELAAMIPVGGMN